MEAEPRTDSIESPVVIVCARNEADRIGATLAALQRAFPNGHIVVADDASEDGTGQIALGGGAELIRRGLSHGKGGNATAAAQAVLERADAPDPPTFLLCDADLGSCAGELARLVRAVEDDECDLAVASFATRVGGGFGVALRFAAWAIRRLCGAEATAPISGQRALSAPAFRAVLPFSPGYGIEIGMTVDAVRAGFRMREYELDLEHRATGRTFAGFAHRARQLRDFARVYGAKRRA